MGIRHIYSVVGLIALTAAISACSSDFKVDPKADKSAGMKVEVKTESANPNVNARKEYRVTLKDTKSNKEIDLGTLEPNSYRFSLDNSRLIINSVESSGGSDPTYTVTREVRDAKTGKVLYKDENQDFSRFHVFDNSGRYYLYQPHDNELAIQDIDSKLPPRVMTFKVYDFANLDATSTTIFVIGENGKMILLDPKTLDMVTLAGSDWRKNIKAAEIVAGRSNINWTYSGIFNGDTQTLFVTSKDYVYISEFDKLETYARATGKMVRLDEKVQVKLDPSNSNALLITKNSVERRLNLTTNTLNEPLISDADVLARKGDKKAENRFKVSSEVEDGKNAYGLPEIPKYRYRLKNSYTGEEIDLGYLENGSVRTSGNRIIINSGRQMLTPGVLTPSMRKVLDARTGKVIFEDPNNDGSPHHDFSADGKKYFYQEQDNTLYVKDVDTGKSENLGTSTYAFKVLGDSGKLLEVGPDGSLYVYNTSNPAVNRLVLVDIPKHSGLKSARIYGNTIEYTTDASWWQPNPMTSAFFAYSSKYFFYFEGKTLQVFDLSNWGKLVLTQSDLDSVQIGNQANILVCKSGDETFEMNTMSIGGSRVTKRAAAEKKAADELTIKRASTSTENRFKLETKVFEQKPQMGLPGGTSYFYKLKNAYTGDEIDLGQLDSGSVREGKDRFIVSSASTWNHPMTSVRKVIDAKTGKTIYEDTARDSGANHAFDREGRTYFFQARNNSLDALKIDTMQATNLSNFTYGFRMMGDSDWLLNIGGNGQIEVTNTETLEHFALEGTATRSNLKSVSLPLWSNKIEWTTNSDAWYAPNPVSSSFIAWSSKYIYFFDNNTLLVSSLDEKGKNIINLPSVESVALGQDGKSLSVKSADKVMIVNMDKPQESVNASLAEVKSTAPSIGLSLPDDRR